MKKIYSLIFTLIVTLFLVLPVTTNATISCLTCNEITDNGGGYTDAGDGSGNCKKGSGATLSTKSCPRNQCLDDKNTAAATDNVQVSCPGGGIFDVSINQGQGQGIPSTTSPSTVLSNAITIIFVIATLVVLFFLVIGAFNWITSGGDKEKIQKARGTIVNALIGLAILALAFLLVNVVTQILGIGGITNIVLPKLSS